MIYLVEDDDSIRELVVYTLGSAGMQAEGFARPSLFWEAMEKKRPKLILLDIMLPEEDGLSILRTIRKNRSTQHIPVMMLTAKGSEFDKVIGLDSGADDYLPKPFGMMELLARVKALLRRAKNEEQHPEDYQIGCLYVCPEKHIIRVNGEDVTLTYKEFEMLCLLLRHRDIVLTRDQFETDDDFIRALADEKVNDIMGARDAKAREEAEAKSKADAEEAELRKQREEQAAMFNNTCKACFADEKYYGEFSGRVEKAVKNGFGELLDQAPAVRDFIFSQPSGPKVLDAMLKDRNTFVRVMGAAGNPTLATIEMYELAKELDKPAEQPQQQAAPVEQPAPKGMPHIGKPGARGGTSRTTFKSDNDIINFVRNCR